MKTKLHLTLGLALFSILDPQISAGVAQGTAFTYQGRLLDAGMPANSTYHFIFLLFGSSGGPDQVGSANAFPAVDVTNGLFTVTLDFNTNFPGADRWLEVRVAATNSIVFTILSPRQKITPAPYAIKAANATVVDRGVINDPSFIGTTTMTPLELSVNNQRAFRIEDNGDGSDNGSTPDGAPNIIGGSARNFVGAGVVGATIAGGGATSFGGFARTNVILADYATIAGGLANRIESGSLAAFIAGGLFNSILSNSMSATIAGGENNDIGGASGSSVIGGGFDNNIVGADAATIGGGRDNDIGSTYSTIGGGRNNNIATNAAFAVIPGGRDNDIGAGGEYAFAAGRLAKANHPGAFVWADSQNAAFASTSSNQFLIRATGGVGIGTASPVADLHVNGPVVIQSPALAPGSTSSSNLLNLMVSSGSNPLTTNGSLNGISFYEGASVKAMSLGYDGSGGFSQNALRIYSGPDSPLFTFQNGGNLGVGTTNPTNKLHVAGGATVTGDALVGGQLRVSGAADDDTVVFPGSSISAQEIANEPGVASDITGSFDSYSVFTNLIVAAARQITCPGPGFIVAMGTAELFGDLFPDDGELFVGLSDSATAFHSSNKRRVSLLSGKFATVTVHGTFLVSAGSTTKTIRLLLDPDTPDRAYMRGLCHLTLMYYPTSYGTVDTEQ